ncbi:MAG: hypothetical protein AB2A00_40615 [Myxococcota bacterium]
MISASRVVLLAALAVAAPQKTTPGKTASQGTRAPVDPHQIPVGADFEGPTEEQRWAVPPAEPVESSPSPFACSAQTLLEDKPCTFESDAPGASDVTRQAEINAAEGLALGSKLCPQVSLPSSSAKPDARVVAFCQAQMQAATAVCGRDGTRALTDVKGRFTVESRVCYGAIRDVLRQVRQLSRSYAGCCQCLLANKCATSFDQCASEMSAGRPGSYAPRCFQGACASDCQAAAILHEPSPPPPRDELPALPSGKTKGGNTPILEL